MKANRRGFLRLVGMAPIAAPVAVKEAAASMGLSSATAALAGAGQMASAVGHGPPAQSGADTSWIVQQWNNFNSDDGRKSRLREAQYAARTLDPDLAAMRSVSPAWAYRQQVAREIARVEEREMGWLMREAKHFGISL